MTYISELNIDSTQLDASGFFPTSQKVILGNYVQDKDNLPLLVDRVGTGSQVWSAGEVTMSVTAGQFAVAQTKICHPYISNHPSLYSITFGGFGVQANVTKRVLACRSSTASPFTATLDGIGIEMDGTTHNLIIRKGGAAVLTLARASWDDPLNGTGASGINYDFNNFTVLDFDYLYLGGTAVRFFIKYGSQLVLFHTYNHAGLNANTFVNSPNFNIRWEIRSTGGTGSMRQICASYSTLGGTEVIGKDFAFDNNTAFVNANVVGTEYLLLAVRLKAANLNSYVVPRAISTLAATNDNYILRLRLNPTIAGAALIWNNLVNTPCEFARGDAAGTNTITATGPANASYYSPQNREQLIQRAFLLALGSTLAGTADILTVSVVPLTTNLDIFGALNMVEI